MIKEDDDSGMIIKEPRPSYGISDETLDFIHNNASDAVRFALGKYFGFSL